jgi:radical SAM superfamily enzyme YgiQ (UPF0313 family)
MFIYSLEDVQSLSKPLWSWTTIQLGISYISSVLKNEGHQTQLVVLGSNNRWRDSLKLLNTHVDEFDPQLVCLTSVASQYPFIKKIASTIKTQWTDKYLILGGAHATLNPSEVIDDQFDSICIGEGEYPILDLCGQLEAGTIPHGIANLWIKSSDGSIERNASRPFLQDIDSLPFPDRAMWTPWMKEQPDTELSVLLGRGCPYECTYCCNHALKKVAPGNYVRFRSPENIIKELAYIHSTYPTQSKIFFEVESIAINKTWLMELCSQLEAFNATVDKFISYRANFRISPQSKDEKIFLAFKKANFYRINIGLESGSARIRREILNRNYSNEDFLEVASMARNAGLQFSVFNMIGLPGETYDDYLETVSVNRQCQPDMHYTGIFFPYPGTELYDMCVREGYIKTLPNYRLERSRAVVDYPQFSRHQIQKAFTWFNYHVYKGYKPLWWILMMTIIVEIRSHMTLNYFFNKIALWSGYSYIRKKART